MDRRAGFLVGPIWFTAASATDFHARIDGTRIVTAIKDDGPGMAEAAKANALRPGVRLDDNVPRDGFGLTIASELAQLYRGAINLHDGETTGLRQTIKYPEPSLSTASLARTMVAACIAEAGGRQVCSLAFLDPHNTDSSCRYRNRSNRLSP
ncbi:ATP-binding protein [Neorhizobium sp. P12A]|uniref:ATP-binding protein n=1 Tax=Neorhizobium sp. P12A TaxID=2268027 RepID=UPI0032B19DC9